MHLQYNPLQLFISQFLVLEIDFTFPTNFYIIILLIAVAIVLVIVGSYLVKIICERKIYQDEVKFLKEKRQFETLINELSNQISEQEILLKQQEKELFLIKRIKKLHDKIAEKILTQDDWYNFKEKFNQVYPLFFKKIKEKNILLTKSEERLVALEKLGLDNTQIAKVLGISVDSVFVNRYRLRKKINAPNTISIVEFLEYI